MKPGTELKEDLDFERARNEGVLIEARQGGLRVYGPSLLTAYGYYQITLGTKPLLRTANQFIVVEG